MKIQDLLLLLIVFGLLIKHNPRFLAAAGIILFILAMPLFSLQIFFTAQRLIVFGFLLILLSVLVNIFEIVKNKRYYENRN